MAKCFSCRNEKSIDTEHVAGKAIMKDFEDMYKKNPDWLIKKGLKKNDPSAAAADEAEEDMTNSKKKKIDKMMEENAEIDPLDATKLDLSSEEVRKSPNLSIFLL